MAFWTNSNGARAVLVCSLRVSVGPVGRDEAFTSLWNRANTVPGRVDCGSFALAQKGLTGSAVRKAELPLEIEVSKVIRAMPFLWLAVNDAPSPWSLRGVIERTAIALLSNSDKPPIDAPSVNWLGKSCGHDRVVRSGLWNQNHVDETYDPAFLDQLSAQIDGMPEVA